jgi:hypothetical protein
MTKLKAVPTLSNKVCWEVALKELLILKGVVQLRVRHAPRLKPAVKDFIHSPQHALALAAGNGQVVYEVPVQVCNLQKHMLLCKIGASALTAWQCSAAGYEPSS